MKKIFTLFFASLVSVSMFATEPVKLWFKFSSSHKPADANVEVVGSFTEGTMGMEKIDTGWFTNYDFVHANADDTFMFRDKTNHDLVLYKYIAEDNNWVQGVFKFGDFWKVDSWQGTLCKWIEEDFGYAGYFWMTGAPDPLAAIKNTTVANIKTAKVLRNGKILILKNGNTYNVLGAKLK